MATSPSDPAVAPTHPLSVILDMAEVRLARFKEEEGWAGRALGWIAGADKFEPLERELQRLRGLPDTPDSRVRARSLLTSLGGELPGTPEPLRPDSGDVAARNRTLETEVHDEAADLLRRAGRAGTESLASLWDQIPTWAKVAGAGAVVLVIASNLRSLLRPSR